LIDDSTIEWVAELAKLYLDPEEKREMKDQLGRIIKYMNVLSELDLDEITPTSHTLELKNVMRNDEVGESFDVESVQKLAPKWRKGHFVVPRIV